MSCSTGSVPFGGYSPDAKANDWAVAKYTDWGIPARNEKWGEWKGWERGVTHIDMVSPRVKHGRHPIGMEPYYQRQSGFSRTDHYTRSGRFIGFCSLAALCKRKICNGINGATHRPARSELAGVCYQRILR